MSAGPTTLQHKPREFEAYSLEELRDMQIIIECLYMGQDSMANTASAHIAAIQAEIKLRESFVPAVMV